jgi:hypothetical protein
MNEPMFNKETLRPGIIRATLFSALAIILVLAIDFPVYYAIVFIAFFWVRVFPFTKFIDKKLTESHPTYGTLNPLIRKVIPYAVYIAFIVVMKILVVDILMSGIFHLPVKDQLYEFLNIPQP